MVVYLGKNRDRLSIIVAIANLSYNLLEKYLTIVGQAGFVQINDSKYQLTEHGRGFLQAYKRFRELYPIVGSE
jgi:predicted transcriptional regulator